MAAALVLFLLLCSATSTIAVTRHENSKIPVSSVIRSGTNSSAWLSPSGAFAMGFYHTLNGYAVCIFLADTVVWTSNSFDPILPENVVALSIELQGLQLWKFTQGSGYDVYQVIASSQESTAWASMLDNGNFVLYNSDGRVIWQSFDYPTDTLLPGQRLLTGQELVSRASETDLAIGMFRLKMQTDGNLVQYPIHTPDTPENAYYSSDTYGAGENLTLNLENDGYLYLYDGNSTSSYNITSGWKGNLSMYLARVDPDGIFRVYGGALDGDGNWRAMWWSTQDKCAPKGICGVNSFCSYQNQIVNCTCLPGFSFVAGGCREDVNLRDCRNKNPSVEYEMQRVWNLTWVGENYYAVNDTVGEEDCGRMCLDDCDCVVAMFSDGKCRRQMLPLRYGIRSGSVSNTALVRVTLAPVPPPPPLESQDGSHRFLSFSI